MARVRRLQPELERLVGHGFELDVNVQDASFFTELSWHKSSTKPNYIDTILALRFSAFGDFFTDWNRCSTEQIAPLALAQIIGVAQNHGFVHISPSDLKETYAGKHPGFQMASWWYRFFDYV